MSVREVRIEATGSSLVSASRSLLKIVYAVLRQNPLPPARKLLRPIERLLPFFPVLMEF